MIRRLLSLGLLSLGLLLPALPAAAEQVVANGPWRLHYIAMASTELTPDIARAYGIERSRRRGVLVLNLQHAERPQQSVPARIEGHIRNLIGQDRLDSIREVREQDAIYTIADFRYSHLETIRFEFSVLPEGAKVPFALKFQQQFFTPPK